MASTLQQPRLAAPTVQIDVVCGGEPVEMGVAQGEALGQRVRAARRQLHQIEAFRMECPAWMPYWLFLRLAERKVQRLVAAPLARDCPEGNARLLGIAKGAELAPGSLYLLNALEAFMSSVAGRYDIPSLGACSALAVRGARSAAGEPLIARNFDYLPVVQPFYAFRISAPRGGLRSLDFLVAPMAGAVDGINEAGLCITYNYAYTIDGPQAGAKVRRGGESPSMTPISMRISEALARCRTVSEAVDWLATQPRWGGGILLLADASGDLASMEISSTRCQLRRPRDGEDLIFHTNCYFEAAMLASQVDRQAIFTHRAPTPLRGRRVLHSAETRRDRFAQLLCEANGRAWASEDLVRVLADHYSEDGSREYSICTHGSYWNTTAVMLYYPRSRRVLASYNSACQAEFTELVLD
jgi:hypothetical protein